MKRRRKPDIKITARTTHLHSGKPSFVFAADDHVRNTAPECRIDNYTQTIFKKLAYRNKIAKEHNIPILQAGDLGDKNYFVRDGLGWDAKTYNKYISLIADSGVDLYCCAGNHDLVGHDITNIDKSVIGSIVDSHAVTLLKSKNIEIDCMDIYGCSWNEDIPKVFDEDKFNVLVIHKMIIEDKPLWPGQVACKPLELLLKYPEYNLIISGDNHNTFMYEYNNRTLVNCGSMMRSSASQVNHKPCFFLYYPESNTVEKIYYPIEPASECMTSAHLDKKKKHKEEIHKYAAMVKKADISKLKTFDQNIEIMLSNPKNDISELTSNIIKGLLNNEAINTRFQDFSEN